MTATKASAEPPLPEQLEKLISACPPVAHLAVRTIAQLGNSRDSSGGPAVPLRSLLDVVVSATHDVLRLAQIPAERRKETSESAAVTLLAERSAGDATCRIEQWMSLLPKMATALKETLDFISRYYRDRHITGLKDLKEHLAGTSNTQKRKVLNKKLLFLHIALGEEQTQAVGSRVNIDPSTVCNFRCVTCAQGVHQNFVQAKISEEAIAKVAPVLQFVEHVDLFGGGEPTLAPHLRELCEICRASGARVELLTNGSMLLRRDIPFGIVDALNISWDGARPETLETIRRGADFHALTEAIRSVRATYPHLSIGFNVTVSRANIDEIIEIVELAASLRLNRVNFTRILELHPRLKELQLTEEDIPLLREQMARAVMKGKEANVLVVSAVHEEGMPRGPQERYDKNSLMTRMRGFSTPPQNDLPTLGGLIDLFTSLGDTRVPFITVDDAFDSTNRKETLTLDEDELEQLVSAKLSQLRILDENSITVPHCMSAWMHNFVDANGRLHPCCLMSPPPGADLNLPGQYLDHLNNTHLLQIRKGLLGKSPLHSNCSNCNFIERYLNLDEFYRFLEQEGGKEISRIPKPRNFHPPDAPALRVRNLETRDGVHYLEASGMDERELFAMRLKDSATAEDLPRLSALYTKDGTWVRTATTMPPKKGNPASIILADGNPELIHHQVLSLFDALAMPVSRVPACIVHDASIRELSSRQLSARLVIKNPSSQWLFGWGAKHEHTDAVGILVVSVGGSLIKETRIQFSRACIPPNAQLLVEGELDLSDVVPGVYAILIDIVRERINWSREPIDRFKINWALE